MSRAASDRAGHAAEELLDATRRVDPARAASRARRSARSRARRAPASGCSTTTSPPRTRSSPRRSPRSRARSSPSWRRSSRRHDDPRRPAGRLPRRCRSGPTARAGGCGSTRGARRCTSTPLRDTLDRFARAAGARCSPRCSPTACARALDVRRPRRHGGAAGRRARRHRPAQRRVHGSDVPPERATRGRAGSSRLELGVDAAATRRRRAARPRAAARTRRGSRSARATSTPTGASTPPCCSRTCRRRATPGWRARLTGVDARVGARSRSTSAAPLEPRRRRPRSCAARWTAPGRSSVRTRETIATAGGDGRGRREHDARCSRPQAAADARAARRWTR